MLKKLAEKTPEEKRARKLEMARMDIKNYLLISKLGVEFRRLESKLEEENGYKPQYKELGFQTWGDFLYSVQDLFYVGHFPSEPVDGQRTRFFLFLRDNVVASSNRDEMEMAQLIAGQDKGKVRKRLDGTTNEPSRRQVVFCSAEYLRQKSGYRTPLPPIPPLKYGSGGYRASGSGNNKYKTSNPSANSFPYGRTSNSNKGSSSFTNFRSRAPFRSISNEYGFELSAPSTSRQAYAKNDPPTSRPRFHFMAAGMESDDSSPDDDTFDYYGGGSSVPAKPVPESEWETPAVDCVDKGSVEPPKPVVAVPAPLKTVEPSVPIEVKSVSAAEPKPVVPSVSVEVNSTAAPKPVTPPTSVEAKSVDAAASKSAVLDSVEVKQVCKPSALLRSGAALQQYLQPKPVPLNLPAVTNPVDKVNEWAECNSKAGYGTGQPDLETTLLSEPTAVQPVNHNSDKENAAGHRFVSRLRLLQDRSKKLNVRSIFHHTFPTIADTEHELEPTENSYRPQIDGVHRLRSVIDPDSTIKRLATVQQISKQQQPTENEAPASPVLKVNEGQICKVNVQLDSCPLKREPKEPVFAIEAPYRPAEDRPVERVKRVSVYPEVEHDNALDDIEQILHLDRRPVERIQRISIDPNFSENRPVERISVLPSSQHRPVERILRVSINPNSSENRPVERIQRVSIDQTPSQNRPVERIERVSIDPNPSQNRPSGIERVERVVLNPSPTPSVILPRDSRDGNRHYVPHHSSSNSYRPRSDDVLNSLLMQQLRTLQLSQPQVVRIRRLNIDNLPARN